MGDRVAVIKKGTLQQVDEPQVLYDHPENLFVAGFIGSPAMNMVEADLLPRGRRAARGVRRETLTLDPEMVARRATLQSFEGKRVIVGIRPEDIEDAAIHSDAPIDRRLRTRVNLREALGCEVLVHFTVGLLRCHRRHPRAGPRRRGRGARDGQREGRSTFVARLSPRTEARERADVELAVDTSRMHFFDPDTGSRIEGALHERYENPRREDDRDARHRRPARHGV